jgi:hypothetical protein
MKLLGFLNLKRISGQIAALVVASIVAIHLILTATFLIHRPDQFEPSIDRGHGQLAAVVQLISATPATERSPLFADVARAFPQLKSKALRRVPLPPRPSRTASSSVFCIAASAAATGSLRSAKRATKTSARSASRCRTARCFPQTCSPTSGSVRSGVDPGS